MPGSVSSCHIPTHTSLSLAAEYKTGTDWLWRLKDFKYSMSAEPNPTHNNNCIRRCSLRFLTISSLRRELSPTCTLKRLGHNRVQIMCNTSSAYHVQHVVLRATWHEGTAQLLSLKEFKSHLFELYFIACSIKPMKEGKKPEYPEKNPWRRASENATY